MNIKFGIPNKRNTSKAKVEKYPETPVLTIMARPEKGGSYKFGLNSKAIEFMGIQCGKEGDSVSFAYDEETVYLGVTTNEDLPAKVKRRVYDNKTFDAADHFNYIRDLKQLDQDAEIEFKLTAHTLENGIVVYRLDPIEAEVEEETSEIETDENEEDDLREALESENSEEPSL